MTFPLNIPDAETRSRLYSPFYYYEGVYFVVQVPEVFCILAVGTKARDARNPALRGVQIWNGFLIVTIRTGRIRLK